MDESSNGDALREPASPNVDSEGDFDDDLGIPDNLLFVEPDGSASITIQEECQNGRPFKDVHRTPIKFNSHHRDVFIRNKEITVTISDCERNHTTHLLNPNLYTITFTHGDFSWSVKKRYKHIMELHQQLLIYRASLGIPFPTKTHRKKRESFRNQTPRTESGKLKGGLPRFPKKPEVLVMYDQLNNRIRQIEDYLYNLLQITIYRHHSATIEFMEVSHLSFIKGLGSKGKEGMMKKRSGSTQPGQSGCNCFGCYQSFCCVRIKHISNDILCSLWQERWIFLKDSCFGYINPKDGRINAVILFDHGFEVSSGSYSRGLHKGMQLFTQSRQLVLKCPTRSQRKSWIDAFKEVAATTARDFTTRNPHNSFVPIRNNITAAWFVDGGNYMSAVAEAIQNAKEEIYIADWWLSPEIYLKRPAIEGDYWRLDTLLRRKAKDGVKIFILLYKEFEMALGLNSYYTKQTLQSENIKVMRHPDHTKMGVFLWAHHEKVVVIDQQIAFLGGVDLCYGRWDNYEHRLTDLGSVTPIIDDSKQLKRTSSTPGGEKIYRLPTPYYKQHTPDIVIEEEQNEDANSNDSSDNVPQIQKQPEDFLLMPNQAQNIPTTPETERKLNPFSYKNVKLKGKELMNMMYSPGEASFSNVPDVVLTQQQQIAEEKKDDLNGSAKYWIGKDYCNFIVKDFTKLDSPFADFIDRHTTPRMPWHDIAVCVQGASARDVARHFIQRWNATKLEKAKDNTTYPYLLPKSYADCSSSYSDFLQLESHKVTCQILRSVSTWSCGFLEPDTVEQSIHDAYVDAINNSEHYIYIENQFFISLAQKNRVTRNLIAESLLNRILRAHRENKKFRVYVVLPLLPGFEGEVGGPTGTSLHAITHWNYASISRGKAALLNQLREKGVEDPFEYISFYGLRTHSMLNGEPITELIYVHSKLMIVDDRKVICGSANINDRSLIGKRDSEIAVLIEDDKFDEGVMDGERFRCGQFAGSLRKFIFKEHLGIIGREHEKADIDVSDPVCDHFYRNIWMQTASLNTEFYEKVFHCIPTDNVETFAQLKEYVMEKPLYTRELSQAEKMLESIEGHLVMLPLNFLKDENLTPNPGTVEGIMPTSLWT